MLQSNDLSSLVRGIIRSQSSMEKEGLTGHRLIFGASYSSTQRYENILIKVDLTARLQENKPAILTLPTKPCRSSTLETQVRVGGLSSALLEDLLLTSTLPDTRKLTCEFAIYLKR